MEYGTIYNKALLDKYFALPDAAITSIDQLTSFDALKKVAEGIQADKDELGVSGAFTSAGFDSSSDWRFKTHLANLPLYYEYKAATALVASAGHHQGTYLPQYKNIFDLCINSATVRPSSPWRARRSRTPAPSSASATGLLPEQRLGGHQRHQGLIR